MRRSSRALLSNRSAKSSRSWAAASSCWRSWRPFSTASSRAVTSAEGDCGRLARSRATVITAIAGIPRKISSAARNTAGSMWPSPMYARRQPQALGESAAVLVNIRNETPPRSHELPVRIANRREEGAFLDGNPVAIGREGYESEQGGTGPAAQRQPDAGVHQNPGAVGRMADHGVGPCSNDGLVPVGTDVAREGGAQHPPAVATEDASGDDCGDTDAERDALPAGTIHLRCADRRGSNAIGVHRDETGRSLRPEAGPHRSPL